LDYQFVPTGMRALRPDLDQFSRGAHRIPCSGWEHAMRRLEQRYILLQVISFAIAAFGILLFAM
jgi:hypothetical protein